MEKEEHAVSTDGLVSALGALVFATLRRMPEADRAAFAADLDLVGAMERRRGAVDAAAVIADLHRAALLASAL